MVTQRTVRQVRKAMLWALTGLLVLMSLGIGVSTWRVFGTLSHVRTERREAEAVRDELKRRNAELEASLAALETPRGLEAEIRTRYPLVKPGEVEFVFVDKESTTSVDTASTTRDSVWSSFRAWIGL